MNVREQQYLGSLKNRIDYLARVLDDWDGRKDPAWYIKELDALTWAFNKLNETSGVNDGTIPAAPLP